MLRLLKPPQTELPPRESELEPSRAADPLGALVKRAVRGDRVAERTLLMAVAPAILAVVRRVLGARSQDIDDVCQESSISLLAALPAFRGECTVLHFSCRVALLTALSTRRRLSSRQLDAPDLTEGADEIADHAPCPTELIDWARRREILRALLDELPLAQAEVLALHVALGYTVEETSGMIGAPINTVRSRLRRGLSALREQLSNDRSMQDLIRREP
jgi:RNA polymerase sigma factor (sigma-70 family)